VERGKRSWRRLLPEPGTQAVPLFAGNSRENAASEDPKLFFTARCAWCPPRKSGNTLTVKLKRPELTKAEWKDGEGKSAERGCRRGAEAGGKL
jgi:hypothetical protein